VGAFSGSRILSADHFPFTVEEQKCWLSADRGARTGNPV
jgi:hypothetical protein